MSITPGPGMPGTFDTSELSGILDPDELPQIPDPEQVVEQVRRQAAEAERIQRDVEAMEINGGSRRGEVRVTIRGNGQVPSVTIDPDALDRYDADELGDLIMEAVNDTLRRVAEASRARFRPFIEAASQAGTF